MGFAQLIADLVEFLYGFWPLRIVCEWEQGLRLRNGKTTRLLGPGLHWMWPIIGDIITEDCVIDINETDVQTCITKDGESATFSLTMQYKIIDLRAMYTSIQDHEDTIQNAVGASAARWVAQMDFDDLVTDLADNVYRDVTEQLESWGINLLDITLFTCTDANVLRLIQDD